jgi:hypothetical protein
MDLRDKGMTFFRIDLRSVLITRGVAAQAASAAPVMAPAFLWAPKNYGWVTRYAYLSCPYLEISCLDA